MALSYAQYAASGSNRDFGIPFQYLDKAHLSVSLNGVPTTAYTLTSPAMVRLNAIPAKGVVVEVRRNTPRDKVLVDFVDGSILTETDLDTSALQVFFLSQEAFDVAGGTLGLTSDGQFAANFRRITSVADPVNDQDAVTKKWALDHTNTNVAAAQTAASAAKAAQTATEGARDETKQLQQTAATSASTATTKASESVAARDRAVEAAASMTASVALARAWAAAPANTEVDGAGTRSAYHYALFCSNASQTVTLLRDETLGYRNAAEQFAKAAELFDPSSYWTKTQSDGRFAALSHTHTISNISNLSTRLDEKLTKAGDTMSGVLNMHYAQPTLRWSNPGIRAWMARARNDGAWTLVDETAGSERFYIGPGGNANFAKDIVFQLESGAMSLTEQLSNRPMSVVRWGVRAVQAGPGSLGMSTGNHADFHWNNGFYYRVDGNGYILINQAPSDARFKEVEGPVKSALDTVRSLNPVTYEFKDDLPISAPKGVRPGFLAQELARVLPSAVGTAGIPNATITDPYGPSYKILETDAAIQLTALLVKAVQELAAQLDTLRAKEA